MPKASRGGKRAGVADSVTTVKVQSGDDVDLSNYPLVYSGNDSSISPAVRTTLERFEDSHKKNKIEYGMLVDANGRVLQEARGGRGSVRLYTFNYKRAEAYTHVHPRGKGEEGCLGGTLSKEDLDAFSQFPNLKTMRASAAEGIYTFTKTAKFDKTGFDAWQAKVNADARKSYDAAYDAILKQYHTGKITWSELSQASKDCYNEYIVGVHNEYLKGQKTYGFTYTLERWP